MRGLGKRRAARRWLVAPFLATLLMVLAGAWAGQALAGWEWNAKFDVEGVTTRTVWTVLGNADPADYSADIVLDVPKEARVALIERATEQESARASYTNTLPCQEDKVAVRAWFRVSPITGKADPDARVLVRLVAAGVDLGSKEGKLNELLDLGANIKIPERWCGNPAPNGSGVPGAGTPVRS